jgi:hypothetical protein
MSAIPTAEVTRNRKLLIIRGKRLCETAEEENREMTAEENEAFSTAMQICEN